MKQKKTWQGSSTARRNSALFLFVFLGMLTAFGPFVTDMYLPSLPAMANYFSASASLVQLGLTFSMLGLAAGQIVFGPFERQIRPAQTAVMVYGAVFTVHAGLYFLPQH